MPDYLVTPPDETDWSISPDVFASRLRERWPESSVQLHEDSEFTALSFTVVVADQEVSGRLSRSGRALDLDEQELELLAELALWFRDEVPHDQDLIFLDEGYNGHVSLRPGMTVEQLVSQYLTAVN